MLKSANKAATSAIFSSLLLAQFAGGAFAFEQPKYDKRIEAAAMEIVATKVGDIRGTVDAGVWVAEYGVDDTVTGPVPRDEAPVKAEVVSKPDVQVASLTPTVPGLGLRTVDRPVRKVSSFLFF
jgi:hypothetical protein